MKDEYFEKRKLIVSRYCDDMHALDKEYPESVFYHPTREEYFKSGLTKCALCDEPASQKLVQEIFKGDNFHDLNNYYCGGCFMAVISPHWSENHKWLMELVKKHKEDKNA